MEFIKIIDVSERRTKRMKEGQIVIKVEKKNVRGQHVWKWLAQIAFVTSCTYRNVRFSTKHLRVAAWHNRLVIFQPESVRNSSWTCYQSVIDLSCLTCYGVLSLSHWGAGSVCLQSNPRERLVVFNLVLFEIDKNIKSSVIYTQTNHVAQTRQKLNILSLISRPTPMTESHRSLALSRDRLLGRISNT